MVTTKEGLIKSQMIVNLLKESLEGSIEGVKCRPHSGFQYLMVRWGDHLFQVVVFEEQDGKDKGGPNESN